FSGCDGALQPRANRPRFLVQLVQRHAGPFTWSVAKKDVNRPEGLFFGSAFEEVYEARPTARHTNYFLRNPTELGPPTIVLVRCCTAGVRMAGWASGEFSLSGFCRVSYSLL